MYVGLCIYVQHILNAVNTSPTNQKLRKISHDGHLVILRPRNINISSVHFPVSVIVNHFRALIAISGVIMVASSPAGGRDSSVGIATRYGLDGPAIESR